MSSDAESRLVLGNSLKDLEVCREGLASAARVVDGHGHITAGSQGESHGHAVIIVGVNGSGLELQWKCTTRSQHQDDSCSIKLCRLFQPAGLSLVS